jgi:GGDEF domain-containing protein
MIPIVIAFAWGAFFGTVLLMLAGALAAFIASHHRVALAAALGALVSAFFVVSFLGWMPYGASGTQDRVLAHVGIFSATMLGLMRRRRVLARMLAVAAITLAASWLLPPWPALALSCAVALAVAVAGLAMGLRSAERGDRPAWAAVFAVSTMLVSLTGVSWIALDPRGVPWPVHVASALAGMAYLTGIGVMLWLRYAYLIEVQEVRAQGPRYDPITRMPSSTATAHLVAQVFHRQQHAATRPIMLIAVSIGNLYALENLHGRAALNHALFICATRLRRCAPPDMEIGRLFEDGFLLISRDARDLDRMVRLGRLIAARLARPVTLNTGDGMQEPRRAEWAAQIGVGLLATTALSAPATVVGKVRDMSRTAWNYASRVAWLDQASDAIAELPALDTVS